MNRLSSGTTTDRRHTPRFSGKPSGQPTVLNSFDPRCVRGLPTGENGLNANNAQKFLYNIAEALSLADIENPNTSRRRGLGVIAGFTGLIAVVGLATMTNNESAANDPSVACTVDKLQADPAPDAYGDALIYAEACIVDTTNIDPNSELVSSVAESALDLTTFKP
jgi:hypothetical protein